MKNFIAKLRNRRLKGNVSLLVIFILLASSVIALLSINQIQRLLTYGNMTFNYFRAFYLAKAGTELGLTEVYYREAGFEQTINSGNAIVTKNFGIYTGFDTHFTMNISGNFQYLTDDVRYTNECNGENRITLGSGEGIMLSLFKDETSGIVDSITGTEDINIGNFPEADRLKIIEDSWEGDWNDKKLTFGLFDFDSYGDMGNIFVEVLELSKFSDFLSKFSKLEGKRRYLTIKNPGIGNEVVSFCITIDNGHSDINIPYSDSLITVRGNYGDMEVGLQSVVKKEVPSWSLNVLE